MGIGDWEIGFDFVILPSDGGIGFWTIETDFEIQ